MKTIYILVATGFLSGLDGRHKLISKRCFTNEEAAIKYIPEFRKKCVTAVDNELVDLLSTLIDDDNLKINVFPLEVVDSA